VANSRGYIAFTDTCAACNKQVLIAVNKRTVRQAQDLVAVNTPFSIVMDALYRSFIAEVGIVYGPLYTPVLTIVPFCFYQVGKQFIRCIIICFTRLHAAFKGMKHAEELHFPQFV